MRYLGIDYGKKHIGISLSDESGTMAFPYAHLDNNSRFDHPALIDEIKKICLEKKVGEVVMGESKDFQGKDNHIMEDARALAEKISKQLWLEVHFEPEFMTSVEARHIQGGGEKTHASAAAIILQSFLDRKKSNENGGNNI